MLRCGDGGFAGYLFDIGAQKYYNRGMIVIYEIGHRDKGCRGYSI